MFFQCENGKYNITMKYIYFLLIKEIISLIRLNLCRRGESLQFDHLRKSKTWKYFERFSKTPSERIVIATGTEVRHVSQTFRSSKEEVISGVHTQHGFAVALSHMHTLQSPTAIALRRRHWVYHSSKKHTYKQSDCVQTKHSWFHPQQAIHLACVSSHEQQPSFKYSDL